MNGELAPPIGMAYLAGVVRNAGHQVQVIDAIGENTTNPQPYGDNFILRGIHEEEVVERINPNAQIIGISGMFSSKWPHYKSLIRKIRKAFPGALVVGGGEHFSAMPEFSLQACPELDLCVLGEGESPLLELASAYAKREPLDSVSGIVFRKDGKTVTTPQKGRIIDVDELPWPAWDLFPLENYLGNGFGLGAGNRRAMPMIATRGCPFQCTFCSSPFMWTTRWIPRSPEKVLDEIQHYQKIYRAEEVQFYDLTAIIKKEWIIQFCQGLISRNMNIAWQLPIGTRSEVVDAEVADHLYRSGCVTNAFAPESGSPSTLKRIKKKVNLDNMKKSSRICIERGLNVKINIILGFPKETHYEVWESMKFAVEMSWLGVHDISFYPFAAYPGTELFRDLQNEGKLPEFTDEWFYSLAYAELGKTRSYCDNIPPWMLRVYQFIGFSLFYGSQYVFRPQRLIRTIRNLSTGKHESRGEEALASLSNRVFGRSG